MTADVQRELADVLLAHNLWARAAERYAEILLPTVQALIADAEKRSAAAVLKPFEDLFAAGPDTNVRSTFRPLGLGTEECAEVTARDLLDAFDRARSAGVVSP